MDFKTLPVIYIKKENKKYVNKILTLVTFTGRKSNGRAGAQTSKVEYGGEDQHRFGDDDE